MNKNRELQILRGITMWAVVGIHTLSIAISNIEIGASGYWFYKGVHTLLQFAVPCFIFIASILLSYKLQEGKLNISRFYRKKIIRIVVPYILWTLIYVVPLMIVGQMSFTKLASVKSWAYWLIRGKGYEHLYFMSVIIQVYLVAPLLIWGVRLVIKYTKNYSKYIILGGAVIGQVGLYLLYKYYIYSHYKSSASLITSYFLVIVMGVYIGFNFEASMRWIETKKKWFYAVAGVSTSILLIFTYKIMINEPISTMCYQLNWYVYTLIMSVVLLIRARSFKRYKVSYGLEWIGHYSFGIYLMHPIQTYLLRRVVYTTNPVLLFIIILGVQVLIMLSCGWVVKIMLKCRLTALIFGEYKDGCFKKKETTNEVREEVITTNSEKSLLA